MNGELIIRPVSITDTDDILRIYAPYVAETAISFETEVPGHDEFAERIKNTIKKYPYLVAEKDGRVVGYTYAGVFKNRAAYDHCVETTVYVDKDMKQSGIGGALYDELERELGKLNISNLNACIALPVGDDPYLTMDSIYFHEKKGYKKCAHFHGCGRKFGRVYDMVWMEKIMQ